MAFHAQFSRSRATLEKALTLHSVIKALRRRISEYVTVSVKIAKELRKRLREQSVSSSVVIKRPLNSKPTS